MIHVGNNVVYCAVIGLSCCLTNDHPFGSYVRVVHTVQATSTLQRFQWDVLVGCYAQATVTLVAESTTIESV